MIHLYSKNKLHTSENVHYHVTSTEIPDPVAQPDLYDIVSMCMIHGTCGHLNPNSICVKDGKSTKNFQKRVNEFTRESVNKEARIKTDCLANHYCTIVV